MSPLPLLAEVEELVVPKIGSLTEKYLSTLEEVDPVLIKAFGLPVSP